MKQRILIVGDTHGDFRALERRIIRYEPDLVFHVGDFGYYPRWIPKLHAHLESIGRMAPIHWIDGNHEDHTAIAEQLGGHRGSTAIEMVPNVFYQPRGSTMKLADGRTILFAGGAFSVDWQIRKLKGLPFHLDLELLRKEDLAIIPDDVQIDIVVSHTAPTAIKNQLDLPPLKTVCSMWDDQPDPSEAVLQKVLEKNRPARWYFGHFHTSAEDQLGETKWCSLNINEAVWLED